VVNIVFSRALGPGGRGQFFLPLMTATTAQTLCMLSLEQVNVYLFATRKYTEHQLSSQNGLLALVMGAFGVICVLGAPALLPGVYTGISVDLLLLAASAIPFLLHLSSSGSLLTLKGRVAWPFVSRLAGAAVQAALAIALYRYGRLTPSLVLESYAGAAIVNWVIVAAGLEGRRLFRIGWNTELLCETLRHTLLIHCGMVLWFLHLRADLFMTRAKLGLAALGQYSLAVTLAETTLLLTDSLSRAILPRQVMNDTAAAAALSLRACRTNLMVGTLATLGWLVTGRWLIPVCFGDAFRPTFLPLIAFDAWSRFHWDAAGVRWCGTPRWQAVEISADLQHLVANQHHIEPCSHSHRRNRRGQHSLHHLIRNRVGDVCPLDGEPCQRFSLAGTDPLQGRYCPNLSGGRGESAVTRSKGGHSRVLNMSGRWFSYISA
jgi:O-antigen/teichoic acid export membrane protein